MSYKGYGIYMLMSSASHVQYLVDIHIFNLLICVFNEL